MLSYTISSLRKMLDKTKGLQAHQQSQIIVDNGIGNSLSRLRGLCISQPQAKHTLGTSDRAPTKPELPRQNINFKTKSKKPKLLPQTFTNPEYI